jgi:hypothetical protein
MLRDIAPSSMIEFEEVKNFSRFSVVSDYSLKIINDELVNIKLISEIPSYTNDDAKIYLDSILNLLKDSMYLEHYKITLDEKNDSLIAIMKAVDNEKKSEIYELFDEFPKSLNSRILTYLS